MSQILIPIAETFTSIQGEGAQSGIRMTFIRLAGCTVGKRYPKEYYESKDTVNVPAETSKFPMLPSYVNQCTTFDGRTFPCDTDYGMKEKLTIDAIIARVPKGVKWVSITGGEPLMHMDKVVALCAALRRSGLYYHIETSGTIIPDKSIMDSYEFAYLACSPKANYIPEVISMASEVRLMVDAGFDLEAARQLLVHVRGKVYLCPLSTQDDITKIDRASMAKCLNLMELPEFKCARISLQIHKILAVR